MTALRIDAHQHYWHPGRGDYDWMPMDNPVLARVWGPDDLSAALGMHEIDATVLVQAAATIHETEYMLGAADATGNVGGVVGWIDFERPADRAQLDRLAGHPKFRGVRPMIQDIADDDWMLGASVQWGFAALSEMGLTFDALGFPRHLDRFLTLLGRYPDLRVVVDHCAKPEIAAHDPDRFAAWSGGMARLARETGAYCKLSGLVTEADADWTVDDLRPYAEHVLEVFGPARVMWGSDWPVCQLRASYDDWIAAAETLTDGLSAEDRARVFGGTASEFYRITG